MTQMSDPTHESATSAEPQRPAEGESDANDVPAAVRRIPRIGVWAWSFVGFVVAAIIIVTALGFVSEILLPMTFAAVLAVCFRPLIGALKRSG